MITLIGGAVVAGTGAFFSDSETSTGNTFTAGELDLKVDNTSYGFDYNDPSVEDPEGIWGLNEGNSWSLRDLDKCGTEENPISCLFFNFADLKPGDYGEDTISLHVQNDAWACAVFTLTGTPENGINDPEADAGDETEDVGELHKMLSFIFWKDDGDNVLEEGEEIIEDLTGSSSDVFSGEKLAIAESGDEPLQAGETTYIGKGWCFGGMEATPAPQEENPNGPTPGNTGFTCNGAADQNHNAAQTDGLTVDVEFYAEQSRNNPDFKCNPVRDEEPG